jgi:L-fuculose-phosphate aldolase
MNTQKCRNSAIRLVDCMRSLASSGLSRGNSGNASVRSPAGMLITPSGVPPGAMSAQQTVAMTLDGQVMEGGAAPSSEWRMHAAIYRERPDTAAIVHCHSRHATALACCLREIPAFHYMVAAAGGDSIRCAPYAVFGSAELAAHAVAALRDRLACLLANHGQIALGSSLENALALAGEVEELAAQYGAALAIGGPRLLDGAAMTEVLLRFRNYGQPPPAANGNS